MELKLQDVSYNYKGKNILSRISFSLSSSKVYGFLGSYKTLLLEILDLEKKYKGDIFIDSILVDSKNKLEFQRQIALVQQKNVFFTSSVIEEMRFIMDHYKYSPRNLNSRMKDALKMVGLPEEFLKRKIATLSSSEKILVKVACAIITNPKIILFDETFAGLDYCSKKKLLSLIKMLKTRKDKIIVLASHDVDLLYENTDEILILENGQILLQEDTVKVFKNENFLKEHNIDIPNLLLFTSLAKKKGVKISYHRDILDLIKDVYKHV